jgi:hypothetical protein
VRAIGSAEHNFTSLQLAFNHQKFATIGDPGLVPDLSRHVVDREALAFVSAGVSTTVITKS